MTSTALDSGARRNDGKIVVLVLFALLWSIANAAEPDVVLTGTLDRRDHETYRTVPFDVPEGVRRITIEFDYTGREQKTTVDLGLLGPGDFTAPEGFRGWSGGNKRRFSVGVEDATPSYLPGALPAGEWRLLLGVPNIRDSVESPFSARVFFERDADRPPADPVLREQAGWYRGDLHAHSGHSDGSCASLGRQERMPCPMFLSLQAAADRGLDFIAMTEHNTVSHVHELRALQPYFDALLLIPGMELTTFQGHANAFGITRAIDFRVGSDEMPDWNALLDELARREVVVSINHPGRPSGEICMGCGWTAEPAADFARVQAVEAVNGVDADTPLSGIAFWHARLGEGHRLTGIGGSDSHDARLRIASFGASRIGTPSTVVHARALSLPAILDGLRSGNVFIDTVGTRDRHMEFTARAGTAAATMGGDLALPAGAEVVFEARVRGVPSGRVEVIVDGAIAEVLADAVIVDSTDQHFAFRWRSDGGRHWLRVDVRGEDGRRLLIGNPIYVNFPSHGHPGHVPRT